MEYLLRELRTATRSKNPEKIFETRRLLQQNVEIFFRKNFRFIDIISFWILTFWIAQIFVSLQCWEKNWKVLQTYLMIFPFFEKCYKLTHVHTTCRNKVSAEKLKSSPASYRLNIIMFKCFCFALQLVFWYYSVLFFMWVAKMSTLSRNVRNMDGSISLSNANIVANSLCFIAGEKFIFASTAIKATFGTNWQHTPPGSTRRILKTMSSVRKFESKWMSI